MRRTFVGLAVLLIGGCGGGTQAAPSTQSATTLAFDDVSTSATTRPTDPPADGRRPMRLAFEDGRTLRVIDSEGKSVEVGPSGKPTWSLDGRYLAWSTLERDANAAPPTLNQPESWTAYILDTVTLKQVRYKDPATALTGVLLSARDGFVAPLSGRNNLGRDATDFVLLRHADLELGQVPTRIHAGFHLERPTSEYDFDWASIQGDSMYVVVTEWSTLVYRYNPQLWRVSMTGSAQRLFFDQTVGLSNLGMSPLAVSPDAKHVINQSGARSGMCYYDVSPVLRSMDGTIKPIAGLPPGSGRISLFVDSVQWTGTDSYLLAGHVRPVDCNDHAQPTSEHIYRCTLRAGCDDTGTAARGAAQSGDGDLAYLEPFADNGQARTNLVIVWKSGDSQRIEVNSYAHMAWSA